MGQGEIDDIIEPQRERPLQIKKVRSDGWTKARRDAFLTELSQSCNVHRAHAAAGMGYSGAYDLRRRDPMFAAQWQQALEIGYEQLELALLRRAREAVEGLTLDEPKEPIVKMTVEQAIDVMKRHRDSVLKGRAREMRPQARQVATQEETDTILMRRIAMVQRQRARRDKAPGASSGGDRGAAMAKADGTAGGAAGGTADGA